jgi:hypothetical protein
VAQVARGWADAIDDNYASHVTVDVSIEIRRSCRHCTIARHNSDRRFAFGRWQELREAHLPGLRLMASVALGSGRIANTATTA